LFVGNDSNQALFARQYEYNKVGNLAKETRDIGAPIAYQYDEKDQLIERSDSKDITHMAYDAVGNRLLAGEKAKYDSADQLKQFGDEVFMHDSLGRMAVREDPVKGKTEYIYGPIGRLASVKHNGKLKAEYGYDTRGRRIWKKVNGKKTYYVYDGLQLLLELDDKHQVSRSWTQGPELDRPVGFVEKDTTYFSIADCFNSIIALTNRTGKVLGRLSYEPFGQCREKGKKDSLSELSYQSFVGMPYDAETGLYYFRARYYDPRLARFITPDPMVGQLSNPATLHPYQYAFNNPFRYRDAFGLWASEVADAVESKTVPVASSAGRGLGYYAGYTGGWVASLPIRAYYWATGNKKKSEQLNQALEIYSSKVTSVVGDKVATMVAKIPTDPLRLGEATGDLVSKKLDQGKSVSGFEIAGTVITEFGRGAVVAGQTAKYTRKGIKLGTGILERYGATRVKEPGLKELDHILRRNPRGFTDREGNIFLNSSNPPRLNPSVTAHEGFHSISRALGINKEREIFKRFIEETGAQMVSDLHRGVRGVTKSRSLSKLLFETMRDYYKGGSRTELLSRLKKLGVNDINKFLDKIRYVEAGGDKLLKITRKIPKDAVTGARIWALANGDKTEKKGDKTQTPLSSQITQQPGMANQPSLPSDGKDKKPTKTEEQVALLKDLKDKTGGAVDLLKPKADAKKEKPDKGKTGTKPDEPPKPPEPPEPPEPPKPPEKPPLPGGENGKNVGVSGRGLNANEIDQIKKQYGAEEVIGEPGNFHVFKNGKWMRPEEVKPSTDTAEGQGDDPTKGPLYASAQHLWEAKQLDHSGQQQIDYGKKPDQFGSDLSKKLEDMQTSLVESTKQKHKDSSTKSSKKTKPGVKVRPGKDFKCKSNQDCWTKYGNNQYYCNKKNGKCIKCSPGYHGKKDGTAACCKD
jgi:RHS repeat-associated protein